MHLYPSSNQGREKSNQSLNEANSSSSSSEKTQNTLSPKCTQICGNKFSGQSCAKIVLVKIFPKGNPLNCVTTYAILDDQSNCSLASKDLLNKLNVEGQTVSYQMASCSGLQSLQGQKVSSLVISSFDDSKELDLPVVYECENIPQNLEEIPTPQIAERFSHLKKISRHIPEFINCGISLLIGRDVVEAHQVHEQIIGMKGQPFAQKLLFGWVIIGEVCLGKVHVPRAHDTKITSFKTHLRYNDRVSIFEPCPGNIKVRELMSNDPDEFPFTKTKFDEKIGPSVEDREFIEIMNQKMIKNDEGKWVAPLPFREPRNRMPNIRAQAYYRALNLHKSLLRNPEKMQHFVTFMDKVLSHGHAEKAPDLSKDEECWYLPIFGVYHPKKPGQIRVVFDSSAVFNGVSLNSVLMQGPDLTNNLVSILLRFRQDAVAVTADIEQMFYCFSVDEQHRNFLRFFWHNNNDPSQPLIEYTMCKHVFGNSPSPAIAAFGLRSSVEDSEQDVKNFVYQNFYVDDGLTSQPTVSETVSLLKRTQSDLSQSGLRLHKIASNNLEVMKCFKSEDLSKDLKSVDFDNSVLPAQCSLGLEWDLSKHCFTFSSRIAERPVTKRGILSTINSIFDPLGFLSPVILGGRLILRDLMSLRGDWDDTIPQDIVSKWMHWRNSLNDLDMVSVPRTYVRGSISQMSDIELHIFSDASERAIASVAYILGRDQSGNLYIGFAMGKSKLASSHGHTIPHLELCATLLASQIGEILKESLSVEPKVVRYYSDSRVVLGYLYNRTRRFHQYVCNRVHRILNVSKPEQWDYISSENNPADLGTRGLNSCAGICDRWILPPKQLYSKTCQNSNQSFQFVNPEGDKEIRIKVTKTVVCETFVKRFEKFSSWRRLLKAFQLLIHFAKKFRKSNMSDKQSDSNMSQSVSEIVTAEIFVIQQVQQCAFAEELKSLSQNDTIPRKCPLITLNPYIDDNGILRVKGCLNQSLLPKAEVNPIILPRQSHVSRLIAYYFHEKVKHQGRLLTEGAIRSNGFWIIGSKRLVSSIIHHCVKCRKLRGKFSSQLMADLPIDRLTPGPVFTYVGVDAFGPWSIVTRKTCGGSINSKRWAILFSCLTSRAVHVEVVEEMSSSSFINALRCFVALRGNVKQFRSDRGTNFVGAVNELQMQSVNVESGPVKDYLDSSHIQWLFNPPHSSHMGGVWERMIGMVRKVLESMFLESYNKCLTHEVLVTFMAEVCAILNSRPLVPISTDPDDPLVLSPSILLHQKSTGESVECPNFSLKEMYHAQWKHVQVLSDMFWKRWRQHYIQGLQKRRKWTSIEQNLKNGDIVLLKDKDLPRCEWGLGIVVNAISSKQDQLVRKVEVRVSKGGKCTTYTRPVTDLVLLVSE